MLKISQLPIAFIFFQLAACGAAGDAGSDPTTNASDEATATASSALLGSDACKNTDITVKNSFFFDGREREIRVDNVHYYSSSEGRWYTQALDDEDLGYDQQHTWWNKDLQHAENDLLTKWRVYFKYRETDGDWSDSVYMELDTPNDTCRADDNYTLTVD
jgi:hypothetical protein